MGNLGLNFACLNFDEKAEGAYFQFLQTRTLSEHFGHPLPGIVNLSQIWPIGRMDRTA
jgi:hypothetical protein